MTDKIIIDGVDVSNCFHRCENNGCLAHTDLDGMPIFKCDSNFVKNCYYKQLKLKEQEIEQYKKEINRLNKTGYCYAYEKGCHEICKQQNCIIKNGYTYKQALDEIEEMVRNYDDWDLLKDILDIINKAKESTNE